MPTTQGLSVEDPSQIEGLPAGATLKPIASQTPVEDPSQIEGLPAGAILKPISQGSDSTATPAPETGVWAGVKRNTAGMVMGIYHAFSDAATPEEQSAISKKITDLNIRQGTLDPKSPGHVDQSLAANPSTATLAYHRLLDAPADQLLAKGNNELAAAKDLWDNQHKLAGLGLSVSGATDKLLSYVPMLGPYINSIAERWESGDHTGALTDAAAAVAMERAFAKITGQPNPTPGWAGKTTEAIAKPVGEVAGKTTAAIVNPFRRAVTVDAATGTSKIEPAVAARTAKAGLAPGEAGMTSEAATAATKQSAIEAQAATQANADQALQNIATQHAKANGLPTPTAGAASRDVIINNGNALVDAGKANYKILDKYTDGKYTNVQQELKNAQLELQQKAGVTGVDTADLEANVTRAQLKADQLFDTAVENGMPKETADAARTQFRTGQATLDAGNAVRMTNKVGGAGVRTTNLNGLENRWQALHDSGRLQQAFGEQGAKDALTQIRAARETGELFESMPSTESKALRDLIRTNTTTGKFGTTTDWGKVRDAFSQMPDQGARFSDIPKVEKFINNQKFYQSLRRYGVGALGAAGLGAAGAAGVGIYKAATE